MSRPDWIKAGALCRTRDGQKVRVVAIDETLADPVIGALDGEIIVRQWRSDGTFLVCNPPHYYDLVGPWVEPIAMDWSALPRWAKYIAMDNDTRWYWFNHIPAEGKGHFGDANDCAISRAGMIPPEYAPKWTGDWRNSLTPVPPRAAS